ncbi:hypothetical protein [Nocardia sp. NPDC127526]|uniref:hypothetical protein n=1 Tax=Nocardia sp. NPDC127526 TaxID=3345393 RepID=UPI003634B75D
MKTSKIRTLAWLAAAVTGSAALLTDTAAAAPGGGAGGGCSVSAATMPASALVGDGARRIATLDFARMYGSVWTAQANGQTYYWARGNSDNGQVGWLSLTVRSPAGGETCTFPITGDEGTDYVRTVAVSTTLPLTICLARMDTAVAEWPENCWSR